MPRPTVDLACALAPCAVAGVAVTLAGLGVDRLCYGAWVVAWRNFVGFNLLSRGADYYGTHLWWKQGPSVLNCPRLRTALGSAYIWEGRQADISAEPLWPAPPT